MRASGKRLRLQQVDPRELVTGKISRNLHYVSISLQTLFYRDLPRVKPGSHIVLGVEVRGVLPGGAAIKTVPEVTVTSGQNAFFFFDNAVLLEPFLYTGKNISITLSFRSANPDEASHIKGRIAGVSDLLHKLNPRAAQALQTARELFTSVSGTFTRGASSWKRTITLAPADTVIRDKPENLLTAARHILLAMPPTSAPASLRGLNARKIRQRVRLQGSRLVWTQDGREYTETPYVILNITRFKRYPSEGTNLAKLTRKRAIAFARESFDRVEALQRDIGEAIVRDAVITATEKNLERSWVEVWAARVRRARAEGRGNHQAALEHGVSEMRRLVRLKELFRHILEPTELQSLRFALGSLRDRIGEYARKTNKPFPKDVASLLAADVRRDGRLVKAISREKQRLRRLLGKKGATRRGAPVRPGWVEVSARALAPAGQSVSRTRAQALARARRRAMARMLGVDRRRRSTMGAAGPVANRRITEKLSRILSDALIVDERILDERREPGKKGGYAFRVKLRAKVVLRGARTDPGYEVKLRMSGKQLREGDEVEVRARVTRDSYLYLFSIDADGNVSVVVPNLYLKVPRLRAGQEFVFPGPKFKKIARISARLPKGVSVSEERLKVIALRRKIPLLPARGKDRSLFRSFSAKRSLLITTILRKLSGLDPDMWADDTLRYTIRAR